jgi:hypothetical protein
VFSSNQRRLAFPVTSGLLRYFTCIGREHRRRDEASRNQGFIPELHSDIDRVDAHVVPPGGLVAAAVNIAMTLTAEGYRELVADLAAERTRLSETNVVRIGWPRAAENARLRQSAE